MKLQKLNRDLSRVLMLRCGTPRAENAESLAGASGVAVNETILAVYDLEGVVFVTRAGETLYVARNQINAAPYVYTKISDKDLDKYNA